MKHFLASLGWRLVDRFDEDYQARLDEFGDEDPYDQVGIREDLTDVIYNVRPSDTPFYSASKKKR